RALQETMQQIELLRAQKETEVAELERLEQQREAALRQYRNAQTRTESRLVRLAEDERALASLIARLERARIDGERAAANRARSAGATAPAADAPGSLRTSAPATPASRVDGRIIYRFGPARHPNGVVLRNQGFGTATAART